MQQLVKQNAIYRMKGPTVLNAEEINAISSEICALILWAGKTPTEGENTQMLEAVQAMIYTKSEVDVFITALSERADKLEAVVPDEASSSNKLADKKYVDASVSSNTAHYVSSSAAGDSFATVAALLAGPCYYGGQAWTPTPNDYAFVQADENHGGVQARYAFVGGQWVYQYTVDTPLPDGAITDDKIGPRTLADEAGALAVPPVGPATLTAHIQHIRNTLKGLVERSVESPLQFIGASGIDVNRDGNTITISETGTHRLPELLEHRFFDHILNTLSWLRADTFSWQDGTVYTAAYNELLTEYNNAAGADETDGSISFKRTPKGYKICAADQHDNVADLYNTTGVAWYYILDVPNQRFKLPRTKFGFTGLRTGAGNYVAPGLPNITGDFNAGGVWTRYASGAFKVPTAEVGGDGPSGNGSLQTRYTFDASRSSSVYGSSQTVQPPATEMYLYFFIGNFTQSAVEQTAGLNAEAINELSGAKLDKSAIVRFETPYQQMAVNQAYTFDLTNSGLLNIPQEKWRVKFMLKMTTAIGSLAVGDVVEVVAAGGWLSNYGASGLIFAKSGNNAKVVTSTHDVILWYPSSSSGAGFSNTQIKLCIEAVNA